MRNKREVKIGNVTIGGNNKIAVQSMTNTDTKDVNATVNQINALEQAGCEIVRSAFYDVECTNYIKAIKEKINIPLVADIHFSISSFKLSKSSLSGTFLRVFPFSKISPFPPPPATPKSAFLASPGPLTAQPITAILRGFFMFLV